MPKALPSSARPLAAGARNKATSSDSRCGAGNSPTKVVGQRRQEVAERRKSEHGSRLDRVARHHSQALTSGQLGAHPAPRCLAGPRLSFHYQGTEGSASLGHEPT